ncbi:GNAT family N-acetyltransferase [Salinimonas sediminis]|nr:GNAT family N-acetyltransferase [Salinimonas sediminis]
MHTTTSATMEHAQVHLLPFGAPFANASTETSPSPFSAILAILQQLRPHLDELSLRHQLARQQQQGYQLAYIEHQHAIHAVAGFVIRENLAWGRHIYIDDLVTDAGYRGHGAGTALLQWVCEYGRDQKCIQVHLDSGVQRFAAHRFYLKEQFAITSHHFAFSLTHR